MKHAQILDYLCEDTSSVGLMVGISSQKPTGYRIARYARDATTVKLQSDWKTWCRTETNYIMYFCRDNHQDWKRVQCGIHSPPEHSAKHFGLEAGALSA